MHVKRNRIIYYISGKPSAGITKVVSDSVVGNLAVDGADAVLRENLYYLSEHGVRLARKERYKH